MAPVFFNRLPDMEMLSCVSNEEGMEGALKMERQSYLSNRYQKWIAIDNADSAVRISRQGFWAALLLGVYHTFLVIWYPTILSIVSYWAFTDTVIYSLIAWRIYKMSRVAAVFGLIVYLYSALFPFFFSDAGKLSVADALLATLFTCLFINGIRGTFAYHRYKRSTP